MRVGLDIGSTTIKCVVLNDEMCIRDRLGVVGAAVAGGLAWKKCPIIVCVLAAVAVEAVMLLVQGSGMLWSVVAVSYTHLRPVPVPQSPRQPGYHGMRVQALCSTLRCC